MVFSLKTDRLTLRDFTPDDFAAFYATTKDPLYQQFYPEHEMAETHWRHVFGQILKGSAEEERQAFQLAICLADGALIGTCGVRINDPAHEQASFGCAVARPYWGRGYALEASERIIAFGFSSLPIHRLYAETISENVRARALAEKLGMTLEGEFKQCKYFRGRWWNTAVYAILKESWQSGR